MAELIPVPETGELIYEYEGEYYPVSVAEDGQYVVSDGVQMYALDPGEVQSTLDAMQWAAELDENVQVLEHRIGRELTSTEREEVVADASKPGPQRHVLEISIQAPQTPPGSKAIKVRHILYSPNNDPGNASKLANCSSLRVSRERK